MAFVAAAPLAYAALASTAVAVAGTAVSAIGQYQQSKRQEKAYAQNAELIEQQGESEAALIREKARRARGSNLAAIGASGVDISGSFADALEDSAINSELDAQTAKWNRSVEANNARFRGGEAGAAGQGALVGGAFGAASRSLSGYGDWRLLSERGNRPYGEVS